MERVRDLMASLGGGGLCTVGAAIVSGGRKPAGDRPETSVPVGARSAGAFDQPTTSASTSPEARTASGPAGERALVILPTYNERENLTTVVPGILRQDRRLEVLIVDDSSPDGTGDLARELAVENPRVHVLERPRKMGLGTAYLTGFQWALERGYDYVFEMDADLSHDPRHLPEFLQAIETHDLVLGSRYLRGVTVVNWPLSRLLLSMSANLYARVVTGVPFTDLTGGFKCFRRRVLEELNLSRIRSEGYSFQIEVTSRAWTRGFRIAEIPIVFVDRTKGESKLSRGIIWEAVWMVWKIRLWRLLRRL